MVEDIIIVPVAIAYDKLLERRFVRHELMVGVVLLSLSLAHTCTLAHILTCRVGPRGQRQ